MALSWGFACVLTGPSVSAIGYDPQEDFCVEKWINWYPSQAHVAFVFTVNCAIPIVTMTLLYLRIIYKLWRNEDAITNSVQLARLKSRKRVTVMLIIVTVVHTVCWSPNYVLYLLIFHAPGFYYGSTTYIITVLLILLNASADPLLYTWYMDGFRRGIQNMLCRCHGDRIHVIGTSGRRSANTPDQVGFSVTTEPNNGKVNNKSTFWVEDQDCLGKYQHLTKLASLPPQNQITSNLIKQAHSVWKKLRRLPSQVSNLTRTQCVFTKWSLRL